MRSDERHASMRSNANMLQTRAWWVLIPIRFRGHSFPDVKAYGDSVRRFHCPKVFFSESPRRSRSKSPDIPLMRRICKPSYSGSLMRMLCSTP